MKLLLGNRAKSVADTIALEETISTSSLSTFRDHVISTLVSYIAYNGGV